MNTKGELAGCVQAPHPGDVETHVCDSQSRKARAAAISAPETGILHQTVSRNPVANHILLRSWMVDICQEPEMGSPEETHGTPEMVLSRYTWETERPGPGR